MIDQKLLKSLKELINTERKSHLFCITRVATKNKDGSWEYRYLCKENELIEKYFNDEQFNPDGVHWMKDLMWDPMAGRQTPSSFGALYGSSGAEIMIETKTCSTGQLDTMLFVDETLAFQKAGKEN